MSDIQKLKDIAQILREAAPPVASVLRNKPPPAPNPLDQRCLRAAVELERMALATDYRALLIRYIQHVRHAEGVDYITGGSHHQTDYFSADEWRELHQLAAHDCERIVADDGTATVVIRPT